MLYHPVSIGSVSIPGNLFLAPVAGYSDRAFRSICRKGGADFAYTEMVSSEALVRGSAKTRLLMARAPNEMQYAVQLFGGVPDVMAQAVRMVLTNVSAGGISQDALDEGNRVCALPDVPDVVDINAGCPVPKIVKTGAGSALTREPERLHKVVLEAVKASQEIAASQGKGCGEAVPITVKIRSGWDATCLTWKEAASAAIEAGAAAVTLHGRTRAQGYEGVADWTILADLVSFVNKKTGGIVPVFGSGDVFSPEAARDMLEQTGCNGVMFARGAMGNPFVFIQTRQLLQTGTYQEVPMHERIAAGMAELKCMIADFGEESACRQMRKRFCSYSKGIPNGASLRTKIISAETEKDYIDLFQAAGMLSEGR